MNKDLHWSHPRKTISSMDEGLYSRLLVRPPCLLQITRKSWKMKFRSQIRAEQLLVAGSLESQVENSWFLPTEPFHEAHNVLVLREGSANGNPHSRWRSALLQGNLVLTLSVQKWKILLDSNDAGLWWTADSGIAKQYDRIPIRIWFVWNRSTLWCVKAGETVWYDQTILVLWSECCSNGSCYLNFEICHIDPM